MVTSPFPVPRFCDLWRQRWEGRSFSPHVDSRSRASFSRGKKLRFKVVRRGTNRSPIEKRSFSAQQSAVFRIVREQMRNCVEWREGLFAWNSILSSLHSNRQQSVRIFIFHAERIDIENRGATLGELSTWASRLRGRTQTWKTLWRAKGKREREREREREGYSTRLWRVHTHACIYTTPQCQTANPFPRDAISALMGRRVILTTIFFTFNLAPSSEQRSSDCSKSLLSRQSPYRLTWKIKFLGNSKSFSLFFSVRKEFKCGRVFRQFSSEFRRVKTGTTSYEPFRKRPSVDELLPSYFGTGGLPWIVGTLHGGLVTARISPPWKRDRSFYIIHAVIENFRHFTAFNFNFQLRHSSTLSPANFNYNYNRACIRIAESKLLKNSRLLEIFVQTNNEI